MFPRLLAVGTRRSFRWLTLSLPREVLAAEMRNSDSDSFKNEAEEENGRPPVIVQDTIRRRLTVCTPCIESVSKLSIGPGSICSLERL